MKKTLLIFAFLYSFVAFGQSTPPALVNKSQDYQKLSIFNVKINPKTSTEINALTLTSSDKGYTAYNTTTLKNQVWNGSQWDISTVVSDASEVVFEFNIEEQIAAKLAGNNSIFADGDVGARDNNENRLTYSNTATNKINWYLFAPSTNITVAQLKSIYYIASKTGKRAPYIFVYTKPTGTGDLGGWYKSRFTYERTSSTTELGFNQFYAIGKADVEYGMKGLALSKNFGGQDVVTGNELNENILFIGIGTDSNASTGDYSFSLQELGLERITGNREVARFTTKASSSSASTTTFGAINFSGGQLSPGEMVYATANYTNAGNYYVKLLSQMTADEAKELPRVGYVSGAVSIADNATFTVQTYSTGTQVIGVNGTYNTNDPIWFTPATGMWTNTRSTTKPTLRLGISTTNLGSNINMPIVFNPTWFSPSSPETTIYKPILDNTITTQLNITNIGRYIVPATGLLNGFIGKANNYVDYDGTNFTYTAPTLGDKVTIVYGTNIGYQYTYSGTAWVKKGQNTVLPTDNYLLANAYNTGDLVVRNNKVYQANGAIAANTAFAIGTTGATWKKISAIPSWVYSSVYEKGDVVSIKSIFYEANDDIPANTTFTLGTLGATWTRIGNIPPHSSLNDYNAGDIVKRFGVLYEANATIPVNTAFEIGTVGLTWSPLGTIGVAEYGSVYPTNNSTTSSGTIADLPGATLTLPTAGIYRVYYNISTNGNQDGGFALFSITNSSNVAYTGSGGSSTKLYGGSNASMATQEITIIATVPTTIKLRWNTNGIGTATLVNNTTYSSVFGFEKIGGYAPLIAGEPIWTDGGAITLGATTTAPTKPTTRTADKIYYKQIGIKTWEVEGVISWASATGAAAGSGDYLITLPNGLQFDNTILTQVAYTGNIGANNIMFTTKGLPGSNVTMYDNYNYFNTSPSQVIPYDSTRFRVILYLSGSGIRPWGSSWIQMDTSRTMELRFSFTFQSL